MEIVIEAANNTDSIFFLFIFNGVTGYFLYIDFIKAEDLSAVSIDIYQLVFGLFGIFMIVIGSLMPKLGMNSVIGLRTQWSMKNETTWEKSQRFGGISYIIGGAVIVVICFFVQGMYCFLAAAAVIAVLLAVDVFYTYKIAQRC